MPHAPAPQTTFDEAQPSDRIFISVPGAVVPASEADVEARLMREIKFDPDVGLIEGEDRGGRHFLGRVVG